MPAWHRSRRTGLPRPRVRSFVDPGPGGAASALLTPAALRHCWLQWPLPALGGSLRPLASHSPRGRKRNSSRFFRIIVSRLPRVKPSLATRKRTAGGRQVRLVTAAGKPRTSGRSVVNTIKPVGCDFKTPPRPRRCPRLAGDHLRPASAAISPFSVPRFHCESCRQSSWE